MTVPECMEGPQVCRRFQGGSSIFLGVFYGLKGSGRIQEGQQGSGRVQEGHGVLGGSIIFLDPKLFLAQNIFDVFGTQMFFWSLNCFWPNIFMEPKLFELEFYFTHNFLWFGHEPS